MNKEVAEFCVDKATVNTFGDSEGFVNNVKSMLAKNISEDIYRIIENNGGEVIIGRIDDKVHENIINPDQVIFRKIVTWQPLIRCKNCMWYGIHELKKDGTDDRRYKPSFCTLYDRLRDPDWFCGDGVPKEKTDANNGN